MRSLCLLREECELQLAEKQPLFSSFQRWVESLVYLSDVGSLWDLEVRFRENGQKGWVLGSHQVKAGWSMQSSSKTGRPTRATWTILHQPPTPSGPWPTLFWAHSLRHFMLELLLKAFTVLLRGKWPLLGEEMAEWVRDIHTENSRSRRYWGLLRRKDPQKI